MRVLGATRRLQFSGQNVAAGYHRQSLPAAARCAPDGVAAIDRDGVLQVELLERLLRERDDRPVRIRE